MTLLSSGTTSKTHQQQTFYRYKYGYSFYLFLLSFSLSELAALLDMAAYFKRHSNKSANSSDNSDNESYFVSYSNPNHHHHHYHHHQQTENTTCIPMATPDDHQQQQLINPADIMLLGASKLQQLPPHSYITFAEDVVTIRSSGVGGIDHYATAQRDNGKKTGSTATATPSTLATNSVDKVMHSFATLRKHNNQL